MTINQKLKFIPGLWFVLPVLLICFSTPVSAQKKPVDPSVLKVKKYKLIPKDQAADEISLPFGKINIIDSRFDTSKIGFHYVLNDNLFFDDRSFKMQLIPGCGEAIRSFYEKYYEKNFTKNEYSLLIVFKRLWMSPSVYSVPQVRMKAEIYLEKAGGFLPVKKIDTVYDKSVDMENGVYETNRETGIPYLTYLLKKIVEGLNLNSAIKVFDSRQKKSMEEIQAYNERRFNLPILKDSIIQSGIFYDFESFKNNKPGGPSFTLEKAEKGITRLYEKKGNDSVLVTKFFALYDGKRLLFGKPDDLMQAVKTGHCFEYFFKSRRLSNNINNVAGVNFQGAIESKVWLPVQLDMETGESY